MRFAFLYLDYFFEHLVLAWPLLGFLFVVIVVLGLIVGRIESWRRFDALYWAFVTATTVGYGDIRPVTRPSRVLSIVIALVGMTFTGILVALAINSASLAFGDIHPHIKGLP